MHTHTVSLFSWGEFMSPLACCLLWPCDVFTLFCNVLFRLGGPKSFSYASLWTEAGASLADICCPSVRTRELLRTTVIGTIREDFLRVCAGSGSLMEGPFLDAVLFGACSSVSKPLHPW